MAGGDGAERLAGEEGADGLLALLIEFLERLREILSIILPGGPLW